MTVGPEFGMNAGTFVAALVLFATDNFAVRRFAWGALRFFFGDVADFGKTFRVVTTEKLDESFAHFAAEVERFTGSGGADYRGHFDLVVFGIGHLKAANFSVPFRIVLGQPFQFLSQFAHRRLVIEIKNYRAEQLG